MAAGWIRTNGRLHAPRTKSVDVGRLLATLRFTEDSLRRAADLIFDPEIRRPVLRAADRLERMLEDLHRADTVVPPDRGIVLGSLEPARQTVSLEPPSMEGSPSLVG